MILFTSIYSGIYIFLITLAILLVSTMIGYCFSLLHPPETSPSSNLLQTAMMTLLSLLLAFGVSMAEVRYEARKQVDIAEANAIGTAYQRLDLLPQSATKLKSLLKAYLQKRIDIYNASEYVEQINSPKYKTSDLENEIWKIATQEALKKPTVERTLVLISLNQIFDMRDQQIFAFTNHVPFSIVGLLYTISVLVSAMMGYLHSGAKIRYWMSAGVLSLLISMTLFAILDLDRPRRGFIRVFPDSLIRTLNSIEGKT